RSAGWRTSEEREFIRWRNIVSAVLDDVRDTEACFHELFDHFSRPTAWRFAPDAADTLRGLATQGYRLALASNYDGPLRRVAAGLPELGLLDDIVVSSEVGWRKPAAPFFAALCRRLTLSPEKILYLGDDPANDYDAARAAGLMAVLFDPDGEGPAGAAWVR